MAKISTPDDESQSLLPVPVENIDDTSKIYLCMSAAIYIFFPLCYIILVILAGTLKSSIEEWSYFINADLSLVTSLLISAGSLGIIFLTFGFCCKLFNYMQLMGFLTPFLLILQIIAVVLGCIKTVDNSNYLQKSINADMKAKFVAYSSSDNVEKRFNAMQNEEECCGVYNVNDYEELNISIPISCCYVSDNMQDYCTDKKLVYPRGCAATVYQDIIKNIRILTYVTIGLIVLQIFFGGCVINMIVRT